MAVLQEYKCPCCTGALTFDSTLQKMKCPYCGTEFEVESLASLDRDLNKEPAASAANTGWGDLGGNVWREGEGDGLSIYVCNSCGGEIIGDDTTAATSCPYCGNPVVMMGKLSGSLKPELLIPFKLNKKAAVAALKKHYSGKRLLPKVFKDENHIDEIKGIYVPFWLFDAKVEADVRYEATRVRTWSDRKNDYTETSYYQVDRGGTIAFKDIPVDGSTKMPDDIMESIEPFDLSQAAPFQTAYLAGYLADKYDTDDQECIRRANVRIKKSAEDSFAATVRGYTSVTAKESNIRLLDSTAKYALLPVWYLNTSWKGNKYTFAMNGQTGKLVGDLALDKAKARKWFWGLTALIAGAIYAVSWLLWQIM